MTDMNPSLSESKTTSSAKAWKARLARPRVEEMPVLGSLPHQPRILYVDDDLQVRTLGKLVLLRVGYEVDVAANGAVAWNALNEETYGLVITDYEMPRMTGLELATKIRGGGMDIPIIVTSASFDSMGSRAWEQLEIASFLPKPFNVDSLLSAVEPILHLPGDSQSSNCPPVPRFDLANTSSCAHAYRHGGIND